MVLCFVTPCSICSNYLFYYRVVWIIFVQLTFCVIGFVHFLQSLSGFCTIDMEGFFSCRGNIFQMPRTCSRCWRATRGRSPPGRSPRSPGSRQARSSTPRTASRWHSKWSIYLLLTSTIQGGPCGPVLLTPMKKLRWISSGTDCSCGSVKC